MDAMNECLRGKLAERAKELKEREAVCYSTYPTLIRRVELDRPNLTLHRNPIPNPNPVVSQSHVASVKAREKSRLREKEQVSAIT